MVTALASLFVAHVARQPLKNVNVLNEAGLFFTRPARVLRCEVDQELRRIGKFGFKPEIMKKEEPIPVRRLKKEESAPCPCPTAYTPSVESIYSDFVTESTSVTTLPSVEIEVPPTPTTEDAMSQLILKAMNTGLNNMYAARERDIVYDEAYICLVASIQQAVEAKWNPVIEDIKGFLDTIVDNVRKIAVQRHRMKMIMANKVPIKTNRLRYHYKGFTAEEPPPPTQHEVMVTLRERRGTFNRYPKDAFGVYVSNWDQSCDESVTREPSDLHEDDLLDPMSFKHD